MSDKTNDLLAPVVLFVYNRPAHTLQTLEALEANELSAASILYIYADGPKENDSASNLDRINETRTVIRKRKWCSQVYIIESAVNKGLANSVIDATTEVVNKYGKVITLEDDVICSKYFLNFMNEGLRRYGENTKVYMVAGYIFPLNKIKAKGSSFFLPLTTTQAWGTWKRAWGNFDPLASGYEALKTNNKLRKAFNLDDSFDYASMLIQQMETDTINSWAIRWWWTVFKKNGLVLYPDKSLVKNIGWDNSGTHSGNENPFEDENWNESYFLKNFPTKVSIDLVHLKLLKSYLLKINQNNKIEFDFYLSLKKKFHNIKRKLEL